MPKTCTPTDQTATATVSRVGAIDGAGGDSDNDTCLPTACTGTQNGVRLFVTGELDLQLVGAAASGNGRLEYSTNGGGAWTTIVSRNTNGNTPSTEYEIYIGSVDMGQVQVRAYVDGLLTAGSGSYLNNAYITAWRLQYVSGGKIFIIG